MIRKVDVDNDRYLTEYAGPGQDSGFFRRTTTKEVV